MSFAARSLPPRLIFCVWLTTNASLLGLPAYAQDRSINDSDYQIKTNVYSRQVEPLLIGDFTPASTTAKGLVVQTSLVKITSVQVTNSQEGLQVLLETPTGNLAIPTAQSQGKILYFDIPRATLAISDGKEFRVENPLKGIANISVTQANASYVRVILTGVDALPTGQISSNAKGLVISAIAIAPAKIAQNPSNDQANDQEKEQEEDVVVTGSPQPRKPILLCAIFLPQCK